MSDCERHSFSLRNIKNSGIPCPFCRAELAEARVKNLEGAARECLSLIDKDASGHARPTVRAMFAVQSVLKRVLRGEGGGDE